MGTGSYYFHLQGFQEILKKYLEVVQNSRKSRNSNGAQT